MGITKSELPEVNALVLGAGDVSPLEMASGYSTLAHRGTHIPPRVITRVERADGSVITFNPPQTQPLTEQQADLVTYALRQVVLGGTGVGANYGVDAAGKTGTTDDNRDAWFIGYLPNGYTTAVWVGYDNQPGQPTRYMKSVHGITVYGGTFPATIWRRYMSTVGTGPAAAFVNPGGFPGKVLNPELTAATSTSVVEESTTTSSTATTVPGSTTTSTGPPESTTTVPSPPTTVPPPTTAPPAPN
jgi:penicillin-binding protein 1A